MNNERSRLSLDRSEFKCYKRGMEYKTYPHNSTYQISKEGKLKGRYNKDISGFVIRGGYRHLKINLNGKIKQCAVHRLVYETWVGPIPEGMQINHKDGNKQNNHIDNLELVTARENLIHSYKVLNRNRASGLRINTAKLSPDDILKVLEMYDKGGTQRQIAKAFNMGQYAIWRQIKKYRTHRLG